MPFPVVRLLVAPALALSAVMLLAQTASARQPPPPPPPPVPEAPLPPPPPEGGAPAWPTAGQEAVRGTSAAPAIAGTAGGTDHDQVVGHWGIEARQVAVGQKTLGQDLECGTCTVPLNAFSVRRWSHARYAWSAGLVFGMGGGSRKVMPSNQSWDTYLGVGPTLGANFLLTSWRHLAVSLAPQLDFVFFMPSGSGAKNFLVTLRGLIEGELHLGFIGVPQLSLGLASGLVVDYRGVTSAPPGGTANQWSVGFAGPQSLWGLVTNMFVRFYF
jgi:hypothetical protein